MTRLINKALISIDLGNALKDQRRKVTVSKGKFEETTENLFDHVYNLDSLTGLPKDLKWAFLHLNKHNLTQKQSCEYIKIEAESENSIEIVLENQYETNKL
jgi:hypothetical protein